MPILPRSLLAALLACCLAATGAPSRAAPEPAPSPAPAELTQAQAAAHARTLANAKLALGQLAAVRKAGEDGPNEGYMAALIQYQALWHAVSGDLETEADTDPDVVAKIAEDRAALDRYRALKVSPDTVALDMVVADDRRLASEEALKLGREAALARTKARLKAEGFDLPSPYGSEVFAKGQTTPLIEEPVIVGVHGYAYTPFTEAPWQVELQWADMDSVKPPMAAVDLHACGGALIAPDWVLTAAHCIWDRQAGKPYPKGSFRARVGGKSLAGPLSSYPIDEVVLPQGAQTYVPSTAFAPAQNDIALLHLATPVRVGAGPKPKTALVAVAPRNMGPIRDPRGLVVSGWGATETETFGAQTQRAVKGGRLRMSPELRFAPLELIDNKECFERIEYGIQDVYPNAKVGVLTPSSLCAGSALTGTCVGDSGGPLVLHTALPDEPQPQRRGRPAPGDRPVVVGIVSWGVGCENFTVFTRVSSYADWINATLAARRARRR